MRLAVLTSTPPSPTEGSGTFVAVDALVQGLARLGHQAWLRPLGRRTGFHTFDRWLYNAAVALRPPIADAVVGVDLDGFLWARRRRRPPFVVALKGVIADELQNERGWVRALLRLQARWERLNCARADRVVVSSDYSAGVVRAHYRIPAGKIAVVPEAVDVAAWRALFAGIERRPVLRPTVLAVARMYPRKRLADLLEATARLRPRIPRLEVRIIGQGPEWTRLHALRTRLGLEDTVTFLGEVSRRVLAVEYVGAHCFCLPTVQEGFGIAFVEAMAAGLPVVGCRAGAVPEVILDGRTGILVSPRSPSELAEALEAMLVNDGMRKDLGDEGRRRAEAFEPAGVAARFLEVLPA